jgi:hypothetical protein
MSMAGSKWGSNETLLLGFLKLVGGDLWLLKQGVEF